MPLGSAYALGVEVQGLKGVAGLELLGDDANLNALAKVAVKQADNLLCGALDAVRLRHEDATIVRDEVHVRADLAGTGSHAWGGDDVSQREVSVTEVGKGLRIGESVRDLNGSLASGAVNGADVTVGDVKLGIGLSDSGGVGGGKLVRHDGSFLM